jgi:hypothetical protein
LAIFTEVRGSNTISASPGKFKAIRQIDPHPPLLRCEERSDPSLVP